MWKTKNAMDYLHYMNFESEAFALYVQPLLTFGYFHHFTALIFTWPDVYCLIFTCVIRFITLLMFIRIVSSHGDVDKYTYPIIAITCCVLYATYFSYYLYTENDTLFS